MTASAILMMIVAITIVWGGLVASIVSLNLLKPPVYAESVKEKTADTKAETPEE